MNKSYLSALSYLTELSSEAAFFRAGALPSLEPVNRALEALERPDASFAYRVVVAGTAGKGTVCRYVEQTLLSEGENVAVLSSPHLQVVNERVRLNGQLVSRQVFGAAVLKIKKVCEAQNIKLTYYEIIVVAGILIAAESGVKILICEVGLGGEFDAVNAVRGKRISALTFVGADHLEILGPKLENVAETKAGIFTADSVLNLSYEQKFSSILSKKTNSKIEFIKGIKQKLNKKIARKICEYIFESKSITMGTKPLPARWEKMPPKKEAKSAENSGKIILDGAHSAPRFEYLISTKLNKQKGPYTLVLGMQKNHDPSALKLLLPYAKRCIFTQSGQAGALPAKKLQKVLGAGEVIENPLEALEMAQKFEEKVLVIGSFYLCGAMREAFYPSQKILDQQSEWPE